MGGFLNEQQPKSDKARAIDQRYGTGHVCGHAGRDNVRLVYRHRKHECQQDRIRQSESGHYWWEERFSYRNAELHKGWYCSWYWCCRSYPLGAGLPLSDRGLQNCQQGQSGAEMEGWDQQGQHRQRQGSWYRQGRREPVGCYRLLCCNKGSRWNRNSGRNWKLHRQAGGECWKERNLLHQGCDADHCRQWLSGSDAGRHHHYRLRYSGYCWER